MEALLLNRKEKPSFGRPRFFDFPKVSTFSNGFYTYHADTVSLIKLDLVYSNVISPKKGVNKILGKMLSEGTAKKNSFEIKESIAKYGAHLEIKAGVDKFVITLYTQKKYFNELTSLLQELLFESTFPANELKKIIKIEAQYLQVNNEKTSFVASNKFKETIFGSNHPYGEVLTEEDIKTIKREDLIVLHQALICKNIPEIFIGGDFNEANCASVKSIFQPHQHKHQTILFTTPSLLEPTNSHIQLVEAVQSSVRIGKTSIKRTHKDFIDLLIANEILGGYFGSRLMKNIREEKGLTYGIYSQSVTYMQESYWVIGADIKKDLVNLAIEEINNEISELENNGVDQDELEIVTNYMAGSFLASINTPFDIIDKFKLVHYHGLSYDYYKDFYERLFTITSEDIQQMTTTYFKNNVELVVG